MNYNHIPELSANVTTRTRKTKSNMAASTVVTMTEQNTSILIDEILTQMEEKDVVRMLEEESKVSKGEDFNEEDDVDDEDQDDIQCAQPSMDDKEKTKGAKYKDGIDRIMEEASLDDLNDVLGKISGHLRDHDTTIEELRTSLEFSQSEIDELKTENKKLKQEITALRREDKRNEYHMQDLDNKHERLDTLARKKNLVFEGVQEAKQGEKEDLQRILYGIFDQMNIDHSVECDTCYRTGVYNRNKPRPIVVSFLKQADRDHVFAKRTSLKSSKDCSRVWINEDLAPTARRTKTMVRLITRQAHEKGIPCKSSKFTVTVDNTKYGDDNLNELPPPLSTQNVKQIQINANMIAYQSEHAPLSSLYPAPVKIENKNMTPRNKHFSTLEPRQITNRS